METTECATKASEAEGSTALTQKASGEHRHLRGVRPALVLACSGMSTDDWPAVL